MKTPLTQYVAGFYPTAYLAFLSHCQGSRARLHAILRRDSFLMMNPDLTAMRVLPLLTADQVLWVLMHLGHLIVWTTKSSPAGILRCADCGDCSDDFPYVSIVQESLKSLGVEIYEQIDMAEGLDLLSGKSKPVVKKIKKRNSHRGRQKKASASEIPSMWQEREI